MAQAMDPGNEALRVGATKKDKTIDAQLRGLYGHQENF